MVFPATNDLLTTYDGATGVKTGHTTEAGYCVVASATRDGRSVIVAVLGGLVAEPGEELSDHVRWLGRAEADAVPDASG